MSGVEVTAHAGRHTLPDVPLTREAITEELQRLREGGATVIGAKSVMRSAGRFYVEGHRQPLPWNCAVERLLRQRKRA